MKRHQTLFGVFVMMCVIGGVLTACGQTASMPPTETIRSSVAVDSYTGATTSKVFATRNYTDDAARTTLAENLEVFVNSGQYAITKVETTYIDGCMSLVRVVYRPALKGAVGLKLRVKLVQTNYHDGGCSSGPYFDLGTLYRSTTNVYKTIIIYYDGMFSGVEMWYMAS